jgi:hypothetical protein
LAEEKRQFDATMAARNSGGGGGSGGGGSKINRVNGTSSSGGGGTINKGNSGSIDMQSVLALGHGPINAAKLNELVASGEVEEYVENGVTKFRNSVVSDRLKNLWGWN